MHNISLEVRTQNSSLPPLSPQFDLNDTGNARRLAARFRYHLIHIFETDKWLLWDNQRWESLTHEHENALASAVVDSIKQDANDLKKEVEKIAETDTKEAAKRDAVADKLYKWAIRLGNHNDINRMFARARGEDGIAKSIKDLDANPHKLAVINGTIDLQSGDLLPCNPFDFITKSVPIKLAIDNDLPPSKITPSPCPRWLQFLNEIFNGDQEIIHLIHKWVGYCLSGETKEQKLMFFWGAGSNGKSVFTKILESLLGEYHYRVPAALLMSKDARNDSEKPSPFKMNTRGKRLLIASEIPEGSRLDDGLIKDLTGGDTISARGMHTDVVTEWRPTAKLIMVGNHKPVLNGTDYAMQRRVLLIPFTQRFEGNQIDHDLDKKLAAELPGIMGWAIEGYQLWAKEGLNPPESILNETAQYFGENDPVGRFIGDCCHLGDANDFALASQIYAAYQNWATVNGEKVISQKSFGNKLSCKGLRREKLNTRAHKGKYAWFGINLLPSEDLGSGTPSAPLGHPIGTPCDFENNKQPCGTADGGTPCTPLSGVGAIRKKTDVVMGDYDDVLNEVGDYIAVKGVHGVPPSENPHEYTLNSGTPSMSQWGADGVPVPNNGVPVPKLPYNLSPFKVVLSGLQLNRSDIDFLSRMISRVRDKKEAVHGYVSAYRDGFAMETSVIAKDGTGLRMANQWLLDFVERDDVESTLETVPSWVLENMDG